MRLKSVKLAGFKSYVDPTEIELPDNVTVFVGPNGCGKSNIVDAIRLGIGESQASLLRGDELSDVIFEGTATRAPAGLASIELLFDNQDHSIGGSFATYAEISLKREIAQDTPSKFYLNGRRCRRKDVQDLFLGSGFGARSYSVIEQGFVGRIVTAKPEELRNHLEEVAGVSKYRERRRETEKKIESTRENLERVKDHATELARQITYLQRQAREAARYSDLKEKERILQAKLVVLRIHSVDDQIAKQEEQIKESSLFINQELAKLQSIRTELDTLRVQEADYLEQFNTIQGESFDVRGTLARIEEECRQRKQRREEAKQSRHEITQTMNDQEAQLTNQQSQITTLHKKLSQVEKSRNSTAKLCDCARKEYTIRQTEVDKWRKEWDEFLENFNVKSNELNLLTEQRTRLLQELDSIEQRNVELDSILVKNDQKNDLAMLHQQEAKLDKALQTQEHRANEFDEELEALERVDTQEEEQRRLFEYELGEIRERRSALAALVDQTLQKDSASSQEQTQTVRELRAQPRVGEIITVKSGYEKAVEAVIGSYLQAITVSHLDFDKTELEELGKSNTLLVTASSNTGIGSTLADVVTQGREFVGELCSHVFIDDSLEEALTRRKRLKAHESTVTKSGIWLGKNWIKFNGSAGIQSTLLHNRTELQELNALYDAKEKTYDEILQNISKRSKDRTRLREERRTVHQQHRELNSRLSELRMQLEEKKVAHYQASVMLAKNQQERKTNTERTFAIEQEITSCEQSTEELKTEVVDLDKKRENLQTHERECNSALARALEEDRSTQAEYHKLDLERSNFQAQITSSKLGIKLLTGSLEELKQRLAVLAEQIQSDEQSTQILEKQLVDAVKKSAVVDQKLASVRAERDAILHKIRENNVAESEQQQQVQQKQQQMHKFREEHIQFTSKKEYLLSELTGLDIELSDAEDALDPTEDEDSLNRALRRTQVRVEKLGAVNLAAEQDLDRQKAEYETYQSRIQDLELSQDTLQQAMHKIDKETLILFNDVFRQASDKFQTVFARLFGGGSAKLMLTDEDPLTAGVAMRVQPPGKQVKNLHQLSDGERALAALAFTFAMFELNPSPICILDEVDAPLDTNNVSQFGKLIHSMANDVQFLIITHSRGTMNIAESLIGITMQEAGVSRVVSVDLE